MAMTLTSSAFDEAGSIPARYTCEGANVSPPLTWSGVPEGTGRLVSIMDDPDAPDPRAPRMTWVHWVVYDIPASTNGLREAADLPDTAKAGLNDWRELRYGGPCPPIGRHRYVHKLFALDCQLGDLGQPTKAQLLAAMEGHILAEAQLIGTYQKKG